jgi:plant cysteine oxidase
MIDQYSMGIFIFPPFAKIPLHDHPEMCVLSRVLYGELHRISLDLLRDDITCDNSHSSWTSWSPTWAPSRKSSSHSQQNQINFPVQPNVPGMKRALRNSNDFLKAPDVTCLYPFEGNLHEFVAGPNGAAVLDVLLPPYDGEHERDCTFYEIREIPAAQQDFFKVKTFVNGIDPTRLCWIVPTGQPEDFHCISGQYLDMGRS